MRFLLWLILGISLLVPPVGGQSVCGTIIQTGATIVVGPGTPGTVTIDPCLVGGTPPDIPSPGTLGAVPGMTGTLPTFPGGGTGADGDYHATADTTLAAGVHNFARFEVDNAVTVTCTGAVTINVQSGAAVNGKLHSTADGASILIRCGGDFTMKGESAGVAAVETTGANADVDIIANGIASLLDRNHVSSKGGEVRLVVLGTAGTGPSVIMNPADLDTDAGDLSIISRYGMDLQAATITTETGTLLVQSFEWTVDLGRSSLVACDDGPEAAIEGYEGVTVTGSSYVSNQTAPIRLLSPSGRVRLDDYCTVESNGNLTVQAQDEVVFIKSPIFESDGGDLAVYCHGGDVSIETTGPGPWGSASVQSEGGAIDIRAADNVSIGGMARIRGDTGSVAIRAVNGDVTVVQNATIGVQNQRDCAIDIRAAGAIDARIPAQSSGGGSIRGESVLLSAGDGGIWLEQERMDAQGPAGIRMYSSGMITIRNEVYAQYDILVSSRTEVDVTGHEIHSWATEGPSGAVTLESWGSTSGRIDATNATVRSGAGDPSGDVKLLVRTPGGVEPPPPAIESFILPKRIVVKINAKKPEKSSVIAAGFFDMGPEDVDLTKSSTLTVGNEKVSVPGLALAGSKYVYKNDAVVFSIKPNRRGSSRAKFKLKIKGDLTGKVDPEKVLELRFECDGIDGKGSCDLTSGKYALKKVRGTLIEPNLYLSRVKAKVKGGGKDSLKLILGLATEGPAPVAAKAVRILFGEGLDVTIPAGSFTREGDVHLFKGDVSGITQVKVDYAREAVTVKGKKMDLGTFKEGLIPVLVGVEIGGEGRAIRVRMNRTGPQLRY